MRVNAKKRSQKPNRFFPIRFKQQYNYTNGIKKRGSPKNKQAAVRFKVGTQIIHLQGYQTARTDALGENYQEEIQPHLHFQYARKNKLETWHYHRPQNH